LTPDPKGKRPKVVNIVGPPKDSKLPTIDISGKELHEITKSAIEALDKANESDPFIFLRSGDICHVTKDEQWRPKVEPANDSWLRGALSRKAHWGRTVKSGSFSVVFPPLEVVRDIASLDTLKFPALTSVTEVPTLRADGTIMDKPGYDPASGIYYVPARNLSIAPIPVSPSQQDAAGAKKLIMEAIGDFPYAVDNNASLANVFGLLLTPVLRPAIYGCTPLAVIDAPQAGTGKSLLADVISIIATGRPSAMVKYPTREEEMEKKIGSGLIAGRPLICFDNLDGELKSPSLALALTAKEYETRLLGFSKNMTVPNMATWIVTGNNIRPGGDMPRRCYQIRLDARQAKPYTGRQFVHPDLLRWVAAHRGELLRALLILVRYWHAAGCPDAPDFSPIGSFEDWHRKIAGILFRCHTPGFLANYMEFIEREDESPGQWEYFLAHLYELYGSLSKTDCTRDFSIAELVEKLQQTQSVTRDSAPSEVADCLESRTGHHRVAIGKLFGARRARRFGYGNDQFWIERQEPDNAHKGSTMWVVRKSSVNQ
jgi:hypothetical protein